MPSRRSFFAMAPGVAATAGLALSQSGYRAEDQPGHSLEMEVELKTGWRFCLGNGTQTGGAMAPPDNAEWQRVSVPHSWQRLGDRPDYVGVAWYRTEIHQPIQCKGRFVRI